MNTDGTDFSSEETEEDFGSPLLDKLKEKPFIFKEPEGYFENLRNEIFQKIIEEDEAERQIIQAYKRGIVLKIFQPSYAIAAILIITICVIGFKFINDDKPLTQNDIAEVVSREKIEGMEEDVLIEALDETEMLIDEEISDDEIIDYLVEHDIDLDLLNEL